MVQNRSPMRGILIYVIAMIIIFGAIYYMSADRKVDTEYSYSEFVEDIEDGAIKDIIITQNQEVPTGVLALTFNNGERKALYVEDVGTITKYLQEHNVSYFLKDVTRQSYFLSNILPIIIVLIIMIVLFSVMSNRAGGGAGGGNVMNFGKSRARMTDQNQNKTTFKDVAGLKEERADLEEIVDFLKDPQKYTRVGARIPKGVLLVGPPGTGKTLLARATSGEAGVPFFSISGSDFVEMFVGVGASRVRDLFGDAKKNAPCIIFIDEIDAVARRRGSGLGGGHDEREQTLNQILVEMDGFGVNEGIIVMAATNRVDILDPAILRPGRFDRKVFVGMPDAGAREEILKVHARNKPLAEDVNLGVVARTTVGFSGADLENLLNESAIIAADNNRAYIKQSDVDKAFIKIGVGAEKKSKKVAEKDRKITAYHESGHAILFHLLPEVGPVHMVSIIPTGGAGGYTMPLPEKDDMFNSKQKMLQNIMVSFGGRIAEDLVFGDITTGASQDIKQASALARAMVTQYGMSEKMGPIDYAGSDAEEVFIGRDWGQAKPYSEATSAEIDQEVKSIIDTCYTKAKQLIIEHRDVLESCAQLLLEKERINREEFEALFKKPEENTAPASPAPSPEPSGASQEGLNKPTVDIEIKISDLEDPYKDISIKPVDPERVDADPGKDKAYDPSDPNDTSGPNDPDATI